MTRATQVAPAWPALRAGDAIAIVAPSGPFDADGLARGRALLERHFRVRVRDDIDVRLGYFAGDDGRRAEELLAALSDPDVRAIVAARGGYGATRLLPDIDGEARAALSRDPKLLVGFSDITALHALWHRAGVGSLHGTMAARIATLPEPLRARWLSAVEGHFPARIDGLTPLASGRARGPLVGGNLAVLCALLGTPFMPDLAGCILFLEDTQERPYRIDRMLTSLRSAGALAAVAGIALGQFTRCDPGPDGTTLDAVLRDRLLPLGVPVVTGVPAGHIDDNLELPLGKTHDLDVSADACVLRTA